MQIHPIANLMPEMSDEDFQALKQDIAENGLLEAIWLTDGQIIDGRHRWRACQELGILPDFREYEGDISTAGLVRFVISLNERRRHLSSSQKAVIALEVERILSDDARKRQGHRSDLDSQVNISQKIEQSLIDYSDGRSAQQAATLTGTNRQYVSDAKRIERDNPELIEPIKQGAISIPEAKTIAQFESERRQKALESIRLGDKPKDIIREEYQRIGRTSPALQMSVSNEWYTPHVYIEAVRQVLGEIDVDPASCAYANETVKAKVFYDANVDGLSKQWHGRVFLNPPYGRENGESNQETWSARLTESYQDGVTTEAILLINAVTDRQWFQPFWDYPICFTNHRVRFYDPSGEYGQPTHGNAFVYYGKNPDRFIEVFRQFGPVVGLLS